MELNEKQKQFLFDKKYITSKMLDALVYEGWQNYFIKNFDFEMTEFKGRQKSLYELELVEKETGVDAYNLLVNIYDKEDLKTFLSLA